MFLHRKSPERNVFRSHPAVDAQGFIQQDHSKVTHFRLYHISFFFFYIIRTFSIRSESLAQVECSVLKGVILGYETFPGATKI